MANLPTLPYDSWSESLLYLHLVSQLAGKVRLALHPPINHWWHATLAISARGMSTGSIPYRGNELDIELDLLSHHLEIRKSDGKNAKIALGDKPICDFYHTYLAALADLDIQVKISPNPYKCRSTVPYPEDRMHTAYDKDAVTRGFQALRFVDQVFKSFRSAFIGKCSPVHLFWHSFDLAVTRFSGRPTPSVEGMDRVGREAYSHEVNSAGFWFGDDQMREAAFYCYTAPSPEGLTSQPLTPASAFWTPGASPMAILRYEDVRTAADPAHTLTQFLESAYAAGANLAKWDRGALETVRPLQ